MKELLTTCNNYKLSDLTIGMEESFQVVVTQKMQDSFRELSGDINPMHIDSEYVKNSQSLGYKDCIVYGMCTASFYSTLVGVYLPGEKCLFHECQVAWPKPVYVGDELTVTGKITDIDSRNRRVKIKAGIFNQKGEKVSRAILMVGVRE